MVDHSTIVEFFSGQNLHSLNVRQCYHENLSERSNGEEIHDMVKN